MSDFPNQEKVTKQEMGEWLDAVKEMAELEVVLNWRTGDEVMFQAIRALIEQVQPKVSREFVESWAEEAYSQFSLSFPTAKTFVKEILTEAGVEVEK